MSEVTKEAPDLESRLTNSLQTFLMVIEYIAENLRYVDWRINAGRGLYNECNRLEKGLVGGE